MGRIGINILSSKGILYNMSTVQWVAVGAEYYGGAIIAYSYNGINWTNSTSARTAFNRLMYTVLHNGIMWVAGGDPNNQVSSSSLGYSYDGINWTAAPSGNTVLTFCVGVDYGGDKFVAVGRGTTYSIAYSYDGINWTGCASNSFFGNLSNGFGYCVRYANSMWVAGGSASSPNLIGYSYNGIDWTLTSSQLNSAVFGIDYNGTNWVAVGTNANNNASVSYSTDGITWTNANSANTLSAARAVKWNGSKFIAVGSGGSRVTSTNGINWTSFSHANATSATAINYNPATGLWVIGQDGDTGNPIMYSYDGTNWTAGINVFTNGGSIRGVSYARPPPNFVGSIPSITSLTYDPSNVYVNFSPSTGGNPPPTTYYYSINNGTFINANTTTSPITITGLSIGVNYTVRLIATNIAGNTAPSNSVSTIINAVGIPPTITSITSTATSFFVSFTPSTGGYPAPSTYQYSLNDGDFINATTTTSPITIQNVSSGLNYRVRLIATNSVGNTAPSNVFIGFIPYPCFKQGTKIITLDPETDTESYVPVESLRRGDLIRTVDRGYKAIELIGSREIENPLAIAKDSSKLYWFRKSNISGLKEDLCVTGDHCILYKSITDAKKDQVFGYMGDIYITEGHYRVPAFLDDRAEPYEDSAPATIWHFALENTNIYHNYGVMANGLLVESSSLHYMYKYSNMELIE